MENPNDPKTPPTGTPEESFNPHTLLPTDHPLHQAGSPPEEPAKLVTPPQDSIPVQAATTVTETKRRTKVVPVIIIVLVLILLGVGGFFLWQTMNQQQEGNVISPTQSTPSVAAAKTIDPMADWKTYVSSESGFMLKHPSQVAVSVHRETAEAVTTVFTLVGPTQRENTEFFDGISLQFTTGELGDKTLEALVTDKANDVKAHAAITKDVALVSVSGINGYSFAAEGVGNITYIYLPDGGAYIQIADLTEDPTNQGFKQIVSDMLATLTFTHEDPMPTYSIQ
jgi:hypothetical protein